jgi:amidase
MLAVDGPMARNVADAAALLQAVAGPDARIPMIVPIEGRDFVAAAKAVPRAGLRIGYCPDIARIGVDPEIERVARQAAFALRDHGCVVEECDLDLSLAKKAFLQLRGQFAINHFVGMLDKVDRFGANVANNIRYGLAQSPKDVAEGVRGQMEILARMNTFFERFDRLITPTTCVPPFPVEMNRPESVAGRKLETYIDWVAPTFALSMTALPVVAVPAGLDRSGLPVGVQIVAPRGNEEGALTVAAAVERAAAMPKPGITERV